MKEYRDTPRPTMTDEEMAKDYPRLSREYALLHQDYREAIRKPLNIPIVGWRSELLSEFEELNILIQDIYEFMDRQKLDSALAKLEKIKVDVVGK